MSSYGEDIIRETFEKLGDAIGVQMQIPDAMIANLGAVLQAQIDLLAELQSTGRLIPAGGHVLTAEEWANRITLADKQVAVSEAWEQGFEYGSGHKYGAEDDGVRLTAEQVEDVEALVATANPYTAPAVRLRALFPATEPAAVRDGSDLVVVERSHTAKAVQSWMTLDLWTDLGKNDKDFDAEYERQGFGDLWAILLGEVRALVQATEPAEDSVGDPLQAWKGCLKPKPISWYRTMTRKFATEHFGFPEVTGLFERTHTASDGGVWGYCGGEWELREGHPAPAEPAEEETKAEDYCCHPKCRWSDWGGINRKHERGADCPIVPKPTSSPVVPAPTETGPWQRIEDVPDGVEEVSDCDGHLWWLSRNVVEEWHFDGTDPSGTKQFKDPSDFAPLFAIKEES